MKNVGELNTIYSRQFGANATSSHKKFVNQIQKECVENCDIEKEAARIRKEHAEKVK